jgi:hypothetical protein
VIDLMPSYFTDTTIHPIVEGRGGRVDMEMAFSRAADGIGARFRLR